MVFDQTLQREANRIFYSQYKCTVSPRAFHMSEQKLRYKHLQNTTAGKGKKSLLT
jgi:hypothetical protein